MKCFLLNLDEYLRSAILPPILDPNFSGRFYEGLSAIQFSNRSRSWCILTGFLYGSFFDLVKLEAGLDNIVEFSHVLSRPSAYSSARCPSWPHLKHPYCALIFFSILKTSTLYLVQISKRMNPDFFVDRSVEPLELPRNEGRFRDVEKLLRTDDAGRDKDFCNIAAWSQML